MCLFWSLEDVLVSHRRLITREAVVTMDSLIGTLVERDRITRSSSVVWIATCHLDENKKQQFPRTDRDTPRSHKTSTHRLIAYVRLDGWE